MKKKGGTSYLDIQSYFDQINKLNIKYPTLDPFVNNDAFVDYIKELEIKSILKKKEDLFIRCGDKMFKPPILYENEERAIFWNNPKLIQKMCKGDSYSLVHFHGASYGYHSMADKLVHDEMFHAYATDGAVVGIDGIHIQTYLKHNIKIPWTDEFYNELEKYDNIEVIRNVSSVFCTKLNEKERERECNIYRKYNLPSITNIFNKINFEEPSLEIAYYPYRVLDKYNTERISNIDYNNKKNTICVIISDKKKRYLSCFYR